MTNLHPKIEAIKRQLLGELAYKLNTEQLTARAMARKIGKREDNISDIMRGKRSPTIDWLLHALTHLGHDITITLSDPK